MIGIEFATPITSGLTPQPAGTGGLSRERAAQLRVQLDRLESARRAAAHASREYLISRGQS